MLVSLVLWLTACAPLIGPYSQVAYLNATSLKAETLALADKATEPYEKYRVEVDRLFVDANKAYEYVKGVPSNGISAKQWSTLIKHDGNLMGKFFERWAESPSRRLNKEYIKEFKGLLADAFDEIICLKANKKEPIQCKTKEALQ